MPRTIPKSRNSFSNEGKTPITDWLNALQFRNERLWTINKQGKLVTKYNGVNLSMQEFDSRFPVPKSVSFLICKENVDCSRKYLL